MLSKINFATSIADNLATSIVQKGVKSHLGTSCFQDVLR